MGSITYGGIAIIQNTDFRGVTTFAPAATNYNRTALSLIQRATNGQKLAHALNTNIAFYKVCKNARSTRIKGFESIAYNPATRLVEGTINREGKSKPVHFTLDEYGVATAALVKGESKVVTDRHGTTVTTDLSVGIIELDCRNNFPVVEMFGASYSTKAAIVRLGKLVP